MTVPPPLVARQCSKVVGHREGEHKASWKLSDFSDEKIREGRLSWWGGKWLIDTELLNRGWWEHELGNSKGYKGFGNSGLVAGDSLPKWVVVSLGGADLILFIHRYWAAGENHHRLNFPSTYLYPCRVQAPWLSKAVYYKHPS